MKLAVYDSKNPDRHLGDLEYTGPLNEGRVYSYAFMPRVSTPMFYSRPLPSRMESYKVDVRVTTRSSTNTKQISPTVRETLTVERTVLTTAAELSDLMRLKEFTLPKESASSANRRRSQSSYEAGHGYPVSATEMAMHHARVRSVLGDY